MNLQQPNPSFTVSLFALRSALFAPRSSLFSPHSSLFAPRSSLLALRSSLLALCLWSALSATGYAEQIQAPATGSVSQAPAAGGENPRISKRVLLNGLPVFAIQQPGAPDVTVQLLIKSGAAYDPAAKGGLAGMTAELLLAGTSPPARAPGAKDSQEPDVTFRDQVNWDSTTIAGNGPAKETDRILDKIAGLVIMPAFAEPELNTLKITQLATLKRQLEDPSVLAEQVFNRKLFEKTTYGRPLNGTPQTVAGITLGDIRDFHRKFYLPNNAALIIVGGIQAANVLGRAGRKFGPWVRGDVPPFTFLPPQPPAATKVFLIDRPDLRRPQVRIGHLGIARDSDDFFPVQLLLKIFPGRLFSRVLEEALARKTSAEFLGSFNLETRRLPGPFMIRLSPATEKTVAVIMEITQIMRRMKEGVTAKELEDAQSAQVKHYESGRKSLEAIAQHWSDIELYRLGANYSDVYAQRIQRVSVEDLRRAAERLFDPGGQIIVVVGNAAALKTPLEIFGTVTVLKD